MRAIPAAVATLLKGKKMIGVNAPSHKITVAGAPSGGTPEFSDLTWYRPRSDSSGQFYTFSFAKCKNGKVIAVYGSGSSLTEAFATSPAAFVANNSLTDVNAIFSGSNNIRGTVFNDGDGELYIAIARRRSAASGDKQQVAVYISPSGNGGDWALHGTIRETTLAEDDGYSTANRVPVSAPLILSSGRWVMLVPYFASPGSNYIAAGVGYVTSDDGGVTWTTRQTKDISTVIGLSGSDWHSRALAQDDSGRIWAFHASAYSLGTRRFVYSADDGVTWTNSHDLQDHPDFDNLSGIAYISFFNTGDGYFYFMYGGVYAYYHRQKIYRTTTPETLSTWAEYGSIPTTGSTNVLLGSFLKYFTDEKLLVISGQHRVLGGDVVGDGGPKVKAITINRTPGMAASLDLVLDNKAGIYSPDKAGDWQYVWWPNTAVDVEQGYGTNLVQTFDGLIDTVAMSNFPAEIRISCRDLLKRALDQTITDATGAHTITFANQTVEAIFSTLAGYAGFTSVTTEATGVTLVEKTFSWESYADAFVWLAELVNFEFYCDETGTLYFVYKTDRQPESTGLKFTLTGTTAVNITGTTDDDSVATGTAPIVSGSEVVTDITGVTTYVKDTDYTITYGSSTTEATLVRIATGSIADGAQVLVGYVYAAYVFREGEDIVRIGYTIDDAEIYKTVIVHGQDSSGNVLEATASPALSTYNIFTDKVLKIDAPDADTLVKCQAIANRIKYQIETRPRKVFFACIAVPWLQIGDCIQVVETTTTISEIYRIEDMSSTQDENGYLMQLTCHYYGYAPL